MWNVIPMSEALRAANKKAIIFKNIFLNHFEFSVTVIFVIFRVNKPLSMMCASLMAGLRKARGPLVVKYFHFKVCWWSKNNNFTHWNFSQLFPIDEIDRCVVHLQDKVTPSTKALWPGASFQNRSY
jgi:hypothetical protein